jgi:orotate phosphoribosyltransferase
MASDQPPADRAEQILVSSDAILRGDHFVYVTGEHGDGWVAKDAVFPYTDRVDELCRMLAEAVAVAEIEVDYVCGPATGGLIVAQWTAHHLGLPAVFAEHAKEEGYVPAHAGAGPLRAPFVLRRGYDEAVRGKRVLVVDDVVNTGLSVRETADAVRSAGGQVEAVACLCTRGNAAAEDVGCERFVWLTEVLVPSWPADECPLCRDGVPVNTRYAHGSDFLAQQAAAG